MATYIDPKISISKLKQLFNDGQVLPAEQRQGFWKARFVGPFWLRLGGMPSCYLSGLWGWLGKKFITENTATNIVKRNSGTINILDMTVSESPSEVDGKTAIILSYSKSSPIPWRWVTDEFRAVDDNTLIGITRLHLPILRHLTFPFLLERDQS